MKNNLAALGILMILLIVDIILLPIYFVGWVALKFPKGYWPYILTAGMNGDHGAYGEYK